MKTTPMRTNESAAGSTRLLHRLTAALLALVLAASAALPVFAADTAPTDTIYINSVSDLLAFADKCGFDQWSKGKTVILQEDLSLEDFKAESDLFEEDITKCLDLASIVAARTTFGGTGNSAVKEQLDQAKEALAADEADAASLA